MLTEVPVHLAEDGKSAHMTLWALVNAETKAELRRIAMGLWIDMRERQAESGSQPVAAVWIDGHRLQPTKEEIAEHKSRPLPTWEDMVPTQQVVEERDEAPDAPPELVDLEHFDLDF